MKCQRTNKFRKTPIVGGKVFKDLTYVCMMLYSENVKGDLVFEIEELDDLYGDYISRLGLTQLRIAKQKNMLM